MTKYQREGDWLVEVSKRRKPIEGEPEFFGDETYLKYCYDMEDYERHLSSLKRLRISPELAAHLGDRMEVTSEEIEVRCEHGYHFENDTCPLFAYPKLIDGEGDKRITLSFNLLRNAPNSFMIEPVGMEIKGKFNLTYLNEFFEWEQNLEEIGRGMKEGEWRRFTVELFEDGDDNGYFYSHKSTTSSNTLNS